MPYDPERGSTATCSRWTRSSGCSRLARKAAGASASRCPASTGAGANHRGRGRDLIQAMRAFGLQEIEASEHDILYGAAISAAAGKAKRNSPVR